MQNEAEVAEPDIGRACRPGRLLECEDRRIAERVEEKDGRHQEVGKEEEVRR